MLYWVHQSRLQSMECFCKPDSDTFRITRIEERAVTVNLRTRNTRSRAKNVRNRVCENTLTNYNAAQHGTLYGHAWSLSVCVSCGEELRCVMYYRIELEKSSSRYDALEASSLHFTVSDEQ